MPVSRLATAAAVASAAGLFSGTLLAQNNAQTVEELVVSVRKTDENIQEVPVQVTSLSSEVVRSEAIREIGDVARLTPSLQFDQGFWAQDTRVSIRGLFNRAGRPSAAVLIDGIDVSSEAFESSGGSGLLNQRLLDVERIEVARGPQSALYGRAAFAGGLNYITRRPDDELTTTADIRIAEEGRLDLRGTVSGPLIDDVLSAKIIGSHYELDGDYTNPNTGGDLGGGESDGIGVSFEWTPSDSFSAYWNNT
ncbi:MAG: TonB-dependent receptor plug domain-containing protein, partial [Gammaproteobacteria bacterium]|nr:TonB-dependent receptor plug domain-containing protein [Gammaproteobacteria bacterium]